MPLPAKARHLKDQEQHHAQRIRAAELRHSLGVVPGAGAAEFRAHAHADVGGLLDAIDELESRLDTLTDEKKTAEDEKATAEVEKREVVADMERQVLTFLDDVGKQVPGFARMAKDQIKSLHNRIEAIKKRHG